jgi:hypothetical protein
MTSMSANLDPIFTSPRVKDTQLLVHIALSHSHQLN